MARIKIITGVDIGSSKVAAVMASISKTGQFTILGHAAQNSKGVSRGSIVNMDEAVRSVSGVLKKLKAISPSGLGELYVNISGETLKGTKSTGMVPLSVRGREITHADIARCIDAASTIYLPFDREIVHRIVQHFSVDDAPPIKNPLGLYASRLACEVYIISSASNALQNIMKCAALSGHDVKEAVYTGIAEGSVVLEKEENAILLLGIGASLTEVSIFFEKSLCDMEILPIGTNDIKDDFKTALVFNDLLGKVISKIQAFQNAGQKINSVVVTGGITFADGIIEYLEEKLSIPVRVGMNKEMREETASIDNARLCTAIGLVKYGLTKFQNSPYSGINFVQRISSTVVEIFNNYF